MPNVPVFIALCDIYHVGNIIGAVSGEAPQRALPAALAKEDWTVDQYKAMFEKIVKGEISIDNDFSKLASTDHVALNLVK